MFSFWWFFAIKTGNPVVQLKKKFKVLDSLYTLFACVFFSLSPSRRRPWERRKSATILAPAKPWKRDQKSKQKVSLFTVLLKGCICYFCFTHFQLLSLSDTYIHSHLLSLSLVDCLQEFFVYVHIILWCPYLITCSAHLFSASLSLSAIALYGSYLWLVSFVLRMGLSIASPCHYVETYRYWQDAVSCLFMVELFIIKIS